MLLKQKISDCITKSNLSPNNPDEYYNFIKEKLYEKEFIKSTSEKGI